MNYTKDACIAIKNFYMNSQLRGLVKNVSPEGEECIFIRDASRCRAEADRPFECRIFPYDIVSTKNDNLFWIFRSAFYSGEISREELEKNVADFEKNIFGTVINGLQINPFYLRDYTKYHSRHPNFNINDSQIKVIREVSLAQFNRI